MVRTRLFLNQRSRGGRDSNTGYIVVSSQHQHHGGRHDHVIGLSGLETRTATAYGRNLTGWDDLTRYVSVSPILFESVTKVSTGRYQHSSPCWLLDPPD